jgi:hypothetical protein
VSTTAYRELVVHMAADARFAYSVLTDIERTHREYTLTVDEAAQLRAIQAAKAVRRQAERNRITAPR